MHRQQREPLQGEPDQDAAVAYDTLPVGSDTLSLVAIDAAGISSTATTWSVAVETPPTCSDTWTGSAGDGSWDTAGNWSTGAVPTQQDYACLPAGSSAQVNNTDTVGRVQDLGTLTISAPLTIADPANASAVNNLVLSSTGTIATASDLDVTSTAQLGGGTLAGSGSLVVQSGAAATVDPSANNSVRVNAELQNDGTVTVGSGQLQVNGTLVNAAGGTVLDNSEDGGLSGGGTLINDGSLEKTSGTGTSAVNPAIDNEGTVDAVTGGLNFLGGTVAGDSGSGSWLDSSSGALSFSYGQLTLGAVNAAGVFNDATSVTINGELTTGDLLVSNLLTLNGSATIGDALMVQGGVLSVSDEADISGSFDWQGGVIQGSGTTVIEPDATVSTDLPSYGIDRMNGRLRNEGTVTVGSGQLQVNGTLVNAAGGTVLDNSEDGGITSGAAAGQQPGQFINEGALQKTSGTGTSGVDALIDNEGTVDAQTGTLSFSGGSVPFAENILGLPSLESAELNDPTYCPTEPVAQPGAWNASSSAAIELAGGCYTFGASADLSGQINVDPDAQMQLGPVQAPNATISTAGGSRLIANTEPFQTQPAQVGGLVVGGYVSGTDELDVAHSFTGVGYGQLDGPGPVVIGSDATGLISTGTTPFWLESALVNRGTLTWSDGPIRAMTGGILWNSGTLQADGESGAYANFGDDTSLLYNSATGTITKTSGTGTTEIDALLYNQGQTPTAQTGTLAFAGSNLTPTADPGGSTPSCDELGATVAAAWISLLSDPTEVVAGTTGAQCADGASATGSTSLDVATYPNNTAVTTLDTESCSAENAGCVATVGAVLTPGQTGYWDATQGAVYSITANLTYSPQGTGTGSWQDDLSVPPSSTGIPTPTPPSSSQYGGGSPDSPHSLTAMCGDPVVCSSGDQTEQQTDLNVSGTGGEMDLTRTYNSQLAVSQAADNAPSAFGYGWTGPFDEHLTIDDGAGTATVQNENGSTVTFTINADGSFSPPPSAQATLTQDPSGAYDYVLPDQTTVVFNAAGNILSSTDRIGQTTSFSYNTDGQMTQMTAPSGRAINFSYNAQGLVATATDPSGMVVSYSYDGSDNLTQVADTPNGSQSATTEWQLGYDSSHQLTTMTDADSNETQIFYTDQKVTKQIDPTGNTTLWSYQPGETDITLPNGSQTRELFDPDGNLVAVTRALGTTAQTSELFTYTPQEQLATSVNGDGQITRYGYDAAGNLTSETDPDGNTTQWTYDAARDLTTAQTPSGETTTYSYNTTGELTGLSRPAPNGATQSWGYTYYPSGNLETSTDPRNNTTSYTYDDQGDQTSQTDPSGDVQTWGDFTADGQSQTAVSPRGNLIDANPNSFTTSYVYDAWGRLKQVTDPDGNSIAYGYDAAGNQTSTTDDGTHETSVQYNADNQPHIVTLPDQTTLVSDYQDGQLSSQINQSTQQTNYDYNPLGELTKVTTPSGRQTQYRYDAAGNQTSTTNTDGLTTVYAYNGDGQVTSINYPGSTPTASFSYTAHGLLGSMSDGTGTSSYSYDQLDRLTSQTNGAGQTIGYGYDLANNQTSITYPDHNQISQTFNPDEQLASVSDWLGNTTRFNYDADGNLQNTEFPARTAEVDSYTYDNADQLTGQTFVQYQNTLASLNYQYNGNGELGQESQTGLPGTASINYGYNQNDQLTSAGNNSFAYNADGDPTTLESTSGYSYGATTDELQSSPTANYSYSDLGQRTSSTLTGEGAQGTTSYSYDQAGRLTKVTPAQGDGSTSSYAYDGNGLLASETIGNQTSQFAWDTTGALPVLLSDGTNDYLYGPNGVPFEQVDASGNASYLHEDQLGSARLLTDSTGAVIGSFSYTPYGQIRGSTGTATTPFGYAGQYTDRATGLQYDQARWYDPSTAQFLTPDPLDAITQQPYAYADADPTSLTDPTGLLFGITWQSVNDFISGVASATGAAISDAASDVVGAVSSINLCSLAAGGALQIGLAMLGPEGWVADAVLDAAGTDLIPYSADYAVGELAGGSPATASQLVDFGESQGWTQTQNPGGPIKYVDENGVTRLTVKSGSPRAPGSNFPHVEIRNAAGQRIDPYGNPVTRASPGNHTPIIWDLP